MSGFPESGHSDWENQVILSGCFRPEAAVAGLRSNAHYILHFRGIDVLLILRYLPIINRPDVANLAVHFLASLTVFRSIPALNCHN